MCMSLRDCLCVCLCVCVGVQTKQCLNYPIAHQKNMKTLIHTPPRQHRSRYHRRSMAQSIQDHQTDRKRTDTRYIPKKHMHTENHRHTHRESHQHAHAHAYAHSHVHSHAHANADKCTTRAQKCTCAGSQNYTRDCTQSDHVINAPASSTNTSRGWESNRFFRAVRRTQLIISAHTHTHTNTHAHTNADTHAQTHTHTCGGASLNSCLHPPHRNLVVDLNKKHPQLLKARLHLKSVNERLKFLSRKV